MMHLVAAKNAQALASEQDYRKRLHDYTVLPDDMKVKWAKTAYNLQSEVSGWREQRSRVVLLTRVLAHRFYYWPQFRNSTSRTSVS